MGREKWWVTWHYCMILKGFIKLSERCLGGAYALKEYYISLSNIVSSIFGRHKKAAAIGDRFFRKL